MKVTMLAHTPEPERIVTLAARVCYSNKTIEQISQGLKQNEIERIIRNCRKSGHMSVFEHASFTFGIEGVSRALTHQLVRHRMASYSQRSQRYADETNFDYVIPQTIEKLGDQAFSIYMQGMEAIRDLQYKLRRRGIPKEDIRMILPNACTTTIVMTMNARELLHFFSQRCCNRAQWEIRNLANEILRQCREVAPVLFEVAGPPCKTDEGCHEEKPCGRDE